jgi:SAM-dependent methyltransferase
MNFVNKYKNSKEAVLEPIFRELRYNVAHHDLKKILNNKSLILDYGCGPEAKFYNYLKDKNFSFKEYFGFDPLLSKEVSYIDKSITNNINFILENKYDLISLFAVIEHFPKDGFDYSIFKKLLTSGGYILITTPTKLAKPILEFLSYRLGIVSKREIEEHQHYFDIKELESIFFKLGMKKVKGKVFEFSLNNYVLFKNE